MAHGRHNKLAKAVDSKGTQCEHYKNLYFGELAEQPKLRVEAQNGLAMHPPKFAQNGVK
jgi:hypothetical protein